MPQVKSNISGSHSSVKSNSHLFSFSFLMYTDWFKKLAPLFQPISSKPKPIVARTRFPALRAGDMYLLLVLIGPLYFLVGCFSCGFKFIQLTLKRVFPLLDMSEGTVYHIKFRDKCVICTNSPIKHCGPFVEIMGDILCLLHGENR